MTLARNSPRVSRWLLRRPSEDAHARVFCFPYSGSGASMYHRWPRRIGRIEICLIQPPGRENRIQEPHFETYEGLAEALVDYLPPFLDRPFGFFGHCGGALPGVELAFQLHQAGAPTPKRVFVSSQVAPQDGPYGRFLHLSADELANELRQVIVSRGGTLSPAQIQMGMELLSLDLEANRRYRPDHLRRMPCGITVIGWTKDQDFPVDIMKGWQYLSQDCRVALLEGTHHEFLSAPQSLMEEIERGLS